MEGRSVGFESVDGVLTGFKVWLRGPHPASPFVLVIRRSGSFMSYTVS